MKMTINMTFLQLSLIFISIKSSLNICNKKDKPILLPSNDTCVIKYCTQDEFDNNICVKDNLIIKTQWLNNIINLGEENYSLTKIAKYSNGDMLVFSVKNPGTSLSTYFYGLKENGRPLFIIDGKETPIKYINQTTNSVNQNEYFAQYNEGEIIIAKTANDKEYLLYFGSQDYNSELYDFESQTIEFKQTDYIFPNLLVNTRGSLFNLKDSNSFLYAGIFLVYFRTYIYPFYSYNRYIILNKLNLNQKESFKENTFIQRSSNEIEVNGKMVSCFQTESKQIICFYINNFNKYQIIAYEENLRKSDEEDIISSPVLSDNYFFKCIHFELEKGIFVYYGKVDQKGPFPIISFKDKKRGGFENLSGLGEIKLNSYIFNTSLYLNDFIKLSRYVFCMATVSNNKEILYIIRLNLFDTTKIKIRYYLIRTFELYNYKFNFDIRLNIFKDSLALASSYCKQQICEVYDTHYSSLILFSYPNSKDVSKDILWEIFEKNEDIENIFFSFNLSNYISIDNNIFGLIYSKIIIKSIQNCENIRLFSSQTKEEIYIDFELLNKDDDINASFINYDLFDCSIGYTYEITEPDFDEYENYPENLQINYGNDNKIFNSNKKIYSGRLSYYNIYLKDKLTKDCLDNCVLCYDNSEKKCIICNYNYTKEIDNNKIYKNCQEKPIEITQTPTLTPTELQTELKTELQTELKTELQTELKTELQTELKTELQTELKTELKIEPTIAPTEKLFNKFTYLLIEKETDKATEKQTNKINDNIIKTTLEKPLNAKDCIDDEKNYDCSHVIVKNEEYHDLENQAKNKILNKTTYHGEKKTYTMENVVLQFSKYDEQNEEDTSNIDLGQCEVILRQEYSIPEDESLIIFTSNIKNNDYFSTYVQYEVYNPQTLELLDLSICHEKISISVSVDLNNNTKSLINSLSKSGHNLFDKNDSFYNDICVTYTTENGTDMSMSDRQHAIEDAGGSLNLCQVGCKLQSFNYTSQKAKCDCNVKDTKSITNINDIEFNINLIVTIFSGLKYSNYLVAKCYKLLLDFKLIQKNIGLIFMTAVLISLLILFFIYLCKGRERINYYIQAVLKNKSVYINNRNNMANKKGLNEKKLKIIGDKKRKNPNKNKKVIIRKSQSQKFKFKKKNNGPPIKKIKQTKSNLVKGVGSSSSLKDLEKSKDEFKKSGIKNLNINIIPIHNINYAKSNKGKKEININNKKVKKTDINIFKLKKEKENKKKSEKYKNIKNKNNQKLLRKKIQDKKLGLHSDYINYNTLNIQELNTLDYKIALLVDKRTYFQYYCSLIIKKQLIIFTFIPIEDYNLVSLKISLFLLSFSLYMTVNAFFFTDYTMHQIYKNNGNLDILKHFEHIIYSSLISSVINILLKQLSLSENNILSIKKEKNMKLSYKKAEKVKEYLRIKFTIFFIISLFLTLCYWYFISCFCAVYTNTQIILIEDSLMSFGVSMLYPFGINLMPGIFRIPALRAKKQDKECYYKISQLLSLI